MPLASSASLAATRAVFAFVDGGGDGGADFVEEFANGAFLLFRDVAHAGGGGGEAAFFAEVADAELFDGAVVGEGGDFREGVGADGFEFGGHRAGG